MSKQVTFFLLFHNPIPNRLGHALFEDSFHCKHFLKISSFLSVQPTECNTYADIDAVYKCLKDDYGVKDERLILYGQSVGSGPTVDLASRIQNLRGVVLHSPILSGLRVLYPVKRTYWFDIFKVNFFLNALFMGLCFILPLNMLLSWVHFSICRILTRSGW